MSEVIVFPSDVDNEEVGILRKERPPIDSFPCNPQRKK
jgi:hypothetical protein